jgi:glycosyltransferase involved in cell wall biosynthesis
MRDTFARTGIPEDRLHVLRHAWDIEEPAPSGEDDDMDYYLFLGRLTEAKGVRTLLEAWKQLGTAAAPRLVIAGEGDLEDEVRAAAERNRQISAPGLVSGEEKRKLLHGCRALIAPSLWQEPLGIVAYEAFEFGKPVIASSGGGFSSTVEDRVSGRLFPPGDAPALAAAVRALEHAGMVDREKMGRAGRAWLEREAGADRWLEGFANIAEPIIERYRKRRASSAAQQSG